MTRGRRLAAWGLAAAATGGLAACGGDPTGEQAYDTKVAVYVGVPLGGPWGDAGQAITRGAVLGLADAHGGVGDFSVRLSLRDVTDDDLRTVGTAGASREAGNLLRDVGAVGAIGGLDPTAARQIQLLGNQTGIGYISASGDQIAARTEDLTPTGQRMAVQLGAPDAAIATAILARAEAADCRRTTLVAVPDAGVAGLLAEDGLEPRTTLRAATYGDPQLKSGLDRALRGGSDCLVVAGQPSGGDPAALLRPVADRLDGVTLIVSRGAASPALAALVRRADLTAEAVVDEAPASANAETRAIDAEYRQVYGTPAPVGVMNGWRSIKLMLRAVGDAGPGGNRRDSVAKALVAAPVPGPPVAASQNDDGTITPVAVSLARAESYGWRAVRALDAD